MEVPKWNHRQPTCPSLVHLVKSNAKYKMTVAEIGVFDGTTTRHYIETIKKYNGKLYAVDWFLGSEKVRSGKLGAGKIDPERVYKTFCQNLKDFQDCMTILKGPSHEQILKIPDKSLDICFIDADHRYESVYKDISLCLPKIKRGGIICGHDCEKKGYSLANTFTKDDLNEDFCYDTRKCHPGVIQAVFDHFGDEIEFMTEDDTWVKRLKD